MNEGKSVLCGAGLMSKDELTYYREAGHERHEFSADISALVAHIDLLQARLDAVDRWLTESGEELAFSCWFEEEGK